MRAIFICLHARFRRAILTYPALTFLLVCQDASEKDAKIHPEHAEIPLKAASWARKVAYPCQHVTFCGIVGVLRADDSGVESSGR
jgi:hypothetical protein